MPLFKKEGVLTLADQLTLENCKLIFRINQDLCPKVIMNLFNLNTSNEHNTRSTSVRIHSHQWSKFNNSFLCKSIMEWSKISVDCKKSERKCIFTQKLKK